MRLVFATDVHGNARSYARLAEVARAEGVDAIALGGDLLPHRRPTGQRSFVREVLAPWVAGCPAPVFAVPGNDDWAAVDPDLRAAGLLLVDGEARAWGEGFVAGYSGVPVTPFRMSDRDRIDVEGWRPAGVAGELLISEGAAGVRATTLAEVEARPTIADELAALAARSDPARTLYLVHTPPFDTRLDRMHGDRPIGSRALRAFLERHQPPLSLHGHVHESPQQASGGVADRLGRTLALNPGASRSRLRAVVVSLADEVEWELAD